MRVSPRNVFCRSVLGVQKSIKVESRNSWHLFNFDTRRRASACASATTMRRVSAAALATARRPLVAFSVSSTNHTRALATSASPAFQWALSRSRAAPTRVNAKRGTTYGVAFAASAVVAALVAANADPALTDATRAYAGVPFDRARAVMEFLVHKGASFSKIEVLPEDPGSTASGDDGVRGFGLFMRRDAETGDTYDSKATSTNASKGFFAGLLNSMGLASGSPDAVVASVPARLAISAGAAATHPVLGAVFSKMLENDEIDERMTVMLLLIMERRRGRDSPIHAYLEALPNKFATPLFWNDDALRGLEGTNLHEAVLAQRKQLGDVLVAYIQPAGKKLVQAMSQEERRVRKDEGSWPALFRKKSKKQKVSSRKITDDEFKWAYAVFWSRALALPIGEDPLSPTIEAIVPGVDFANHSCLKPNARWKVTRANGGEENSEQTVQLVCVANNVPAPGEELYISYGDKPNEELLFIHGFADRENKHDVLVLRAPVMNGEAAGDKKSETPKTPETKLALELLAEAFTARLTLLKLLGLPPQVVLPARPPKSLHLLPEETKLTLAVWGATPVVLDQWLRYELDLRLGTMKGGSDGNGNKTSPMDDTSIHSAALTGLRAAIETQTARLHLATAAPSPQTERPGFGEGDSRKAGTKRAIKSAVAAAKARRVDEVVAADPLAPSTAKQAATYRAGVRRMLRAYEDTTRKWT